MNKLKILVTYSNTPNCVESVLKHNGMHPSFNQNKYIPVLASAETYTGNNTFFKNILHDNDGDNISIFNQSLNEYTVLYWAHKNYNKIGNPEYVGHCHYRRMFDVDNNINLDKNTIFINQYKMNIPIATQVFIDHTPNVAEVFSAYTYKFIRTFPNEANEFIYWMSQNIFFAWHNFIMHRDRFFKYMELMTKYIQLLMPLIYQFPNNQDRSTTFIPERLTSFVIWKMANTDKSIKLYQGEYTKLDDVKI